MTPEEFVLGIRRGVLEDNFTIYRKSFDRSASTSDGRDTDSPQMASFYESLTEDQQQRFMGYVRQIIVDTIANVFAVLDGVNTPEKDWDYFHLTHNAECPEPPDLNGDLSDIFLGAEEEE